MKPCLRDFSEAALFVLVLLVMSACGRAPHDPKDGFDPDYIRTLEFVCTKPMVIRASPEGRPRCYMPETKGP